MTPRSVLWALALPTVLLPAAAHAQAAKVTEADESRKEEARSHFDLGVSHFDREEWQAALVEFLQSRALYPTKGNTKNAAICLRKVGRFDEALDLFEALAREFPDLSPTDRALAEHEIQELQASVGTLDVRDAPAGAMVTIDAVSRGRTPLATPLRLSAGTHVVRVTLEGTLPFEARLDLAGRQAAVLRAVLVPLTRAGRLRVTEREGERLEVVVDGAVAGTTPWEGALAPGAHTVLSRGAGTRGTTPVQVAVPVDQVTALQLHAIDLPSVLRIDASPGAARITLDGVPVGQGNWEGRVQSGPHHVVVALEGYAPFVRDSDLAGTPREVVTATLRPSAADRARFALELDGGAALGLVWGGDLMAACTASCSRPLPIGGAAEVRVTYETSSGFGAGLEAGYVGLAASMTGRPETLSVVGMPPSAGAASDALRLDGLAAGLHAQYASRTPWPITLRLGIGAVVGSVSDRRTAAFAGISPIDAEERSGASFLYVRPEARVGRRLGDRLEVSIGVEALLMTALSVPAWNGASPLVVTAQGRAQEATLPTASLSGAFVLSAIPELGVRYEF